jgi:hypothetical protein
LLPFNKQKHKRQLLKVSSEHEAELKGAQESFQKNKQQWKNRLAAVQEETSKEKEKWQLKLDALNAELDKANDRVYQEPAAVPKYKSKSTKRHVFK